MIGIEDGAGELEQESDTLRLAVLGAIRAQGRTLTERHRHLARRVAHAWAHASEVEVVRILVALQLRPDDVLPPDDAQLARIMELGREADAA